MMYIPAFDPFAACYRMLRILEHMGCAAPVEVDRLRMFDYYLAFPARVYAIHLRRGESGFRNLRRQYVSRQANPYQAVVSDRRLFERMRPYQMAALCRLAACGIVSPHWLARGEVRVASQSRLRQLTCATAPLPVAGRNVIAWLCHCFRTTPLGGEYGLKYRTQLMEYKYDGQ